LWAVPDKRQQSKQRRAARNRANRDALAARRENAEVAAPARSTRATAANGSGGSGGSNGTAGARPTGGSMLGRRLLGGAGTGRTTARGGTTGTASPNTGRIATAVALALAIGGGLLALTLDVPVDDRGEALPRTFQKVAVEARERLTGADIGDQSRSVLDVVGPSVLLQIAVPILVAAFAVWAVRRPNRSRLLTFAMLAMAGAVILTTTLGALFFPALIALAVAGFRVRKADMPSVAAERATGRASGTPAAERPSLAGLFGFGGARTPARPRGGDVIDAEATEVEPTDAEVRDADEAGDTGADTGDGTGDGTDEDVADKPGR
jgi:hypothetical protein